MLDYPLFGDEGAAEYDVLDLRTESNYSWAAWGDSVNGLQNSYLREVFTRDTQGDLGNPYTRSRYVHLYLNGQYWGLFMTQERVQEHFGETYFGGDKDDYDVVKADSSESYTTEVADGNADAWRQLFELSQDLADNPSANADNYWSMQGLDPNGVRDEQLEVLLDVGNLIDFMAIIIYTGGHDTGISLFLGNDRANNWFGIRNRETGDQGFQFFLHDNEHSLGSGEINGTLHGTVSIDRTGPFYTPLDDDYDFFNPVYLHQDLLVHPEYVQRFVDRVQELMFNDGPLTLEANVARMLERKEQVEPAILAEAARWGDAKRSNPYTKADWDAEVAWLLDTALPTRSDLVLNQLRSDGLYNQYGPPIFSQLGGEAPAGYPLELRSFEGAIYYSLDGETDPRQIGGGVNPSPEVQAYTTPILLTQDTTVWARVREASGNWSGLVKTSFSVPELAGDYNQDGVVSQADYVVWRSTYGSTSDLRADGNKDQVVDAADYSLWRDALSGQPTVAAPAAATPANVTGVSTDLSVLGGAGVGEGSLNYTWTATGPAGVSFSTNEDNASKNTTATFSQAGEYQFTVTIENPLVGSIAVSTVEVIVEQAVAGVAISTSDPFVAAGSTLQLETSEIDQFGLTIGEPANALWSLESGVGSVNTVGLYTAPLTPGAATVHVGTLSGEASIGLQVVAPIAWYRADETSGSTLGDSSPHGSHASVNGAASCERASAATHCRSPVAVLSCQTASSAASKTSRLALGSILIIQTPGQGSLTSGAAPPAICSSPQQPAPRADRCDLRSKPAARQSSRSTGRRFRLGSGATWR